MNLSHLQAFSPNVTYLSMDCQYFVLLFLIDLPGDKRYILEANSG